MALLCAMPLSPISPSPHTLSQHYSIASGLGGYGHSLLTLTLTLNLLPPQLHQHYVLFDFRPNTDTRRTAPVPPTGLSADASPPHQNQGPSIHTRFSRLHVVLVNRQSRLG